MPKPTRAKVKRSITQPDRWLAHGMYGDKPVPRTAKYFDTWAEALAHANKLVARRRCPIRRSGRLGIYPDTCDRTLQGCHQIWGPDVDHAEALRRNKQYDDALQHAIRTANAFLHRFAI
jgi:hypothetical protein